MDRIRLSALLCVLALAACSDSDNGGNGTGSGSSNSSTVRFIAFGDAGRGTPNQTAVGEAMAEICELRGCDFAIELGDNFYDAGVQSVNDEQFQTKFEIPYASLKVPVYVTLGNHDNSIAYGEGFDNSRGNFQVEYHYLAGRTSDKWRMPERYYTFTAPLGGSGTPVAQFFSLDSNPLTAIVSDLNPQWVPVLYGSEQLAWLKSELTASEANWTVAFAHHPYLSNGIHGNAGNYDGVPDIIPTTTSGKPWKDLLEASICAQGVDLYVAGHDHDLEWLKPVDSCGKTQFIVSGAAEGPRPFGSATRNEAYWQVDNTLGFFWIELRGNTMTAAAYTLGGDLKLVTGPDGKPAAAFEQSVTKTP